MPNIKWLGIDWSYFFSNLGLYVAVIVALQWFYDQRTKQDLLMQVTEAAISNTNVARSGIDNFVSITREISYEKLFVDNEFVVIGFHHNPRIVDQYVKELEDRVRTGKSTTVLLLNPEGISIDYLSRFESDSGHLKPVIRKSIQKLSALNQIENAKKPINIKLHDSVLRYSFVCANQGVWIKPYRNSTGRDNTPGIYVRSSSPLYEYHKRDIFELLEGAHDV
ncbi:MAG: hypothetical protein OXM59_12310 [Gammaproteobacteria bacterium]|nr:hypothetical protein [Gammaproteobacteria bacterium]